MSIGAIWGEIWEASIWDASIWEQSGSYPDLPIDNNSARSPVSMTRTDIMENGTIRQRDFTAVVIYEFDVLHSYVTQSEAESVVSNWDANRITAQDFAWIDGVTYSVRYMSPPVMTHMVGAYWSVTTKLIGSAS